MNSKVVTINQKKYITTNKKVVICNYNFYKISYNESDEKILKIDTIDSEIVKQQYRIINIHTKRIEQEY